MCGIAGIVGLRADAIERMTDALAHRGPDQRGVVRFSEGALGHRRLAVIDLEGGHQPMQSADGVLCVTYNGEIYNFKQLRRQLASFGHRFVTDCDTEILLHGYRQWGDAVIDRINGMFAFALWDQREGRLLLARDRLGIKPLYYVRVGEGLVFGSEPKAVLAYPGCARQLDPVALDAYLELNYVPPPYSMFAGVCQLEPGSKLVWSQGHVEGARYWDCKPMLAPRRSVEQWAELVEPLLIDAIRIRMMSDVPLGAFLSGGVDSSMIVSVMANESARPITTFCVGYGSEGRSYDERSVARSVVRRYATDHHELELGPDVLRELPAVVQAFDEPFGSPTALLLGSLSRYARQRVTVALAGDGGDELFGGYPRYRGMQWAGWVSRAPRRWVALGRKWMPGRERPKARSYLRWGRSFLDGLSHSPADRYAKWVGYADPGQRDRMLADGAGVRAGGRIAPVQAAFFRPRHGDDLQRAAYADLHGFLPDNVLRGTDRMSMAHGLEVRVPMCDHRLVELAAQLPSWQRVSLLASKRVLRRIGRGRLPARVRFRRKLGFNGPVGLWIRRQLGPLVDRYLSPEVVRTRGVFEPAAIEALVGEHRAGVRDHGVRLWSLIVLEQWQRQYLD